MCNFEITVNDVVYAIKNLKDKISQTPEHIPSYFIKRIMPSIAPMLTFVLNFSLKLNIIPSQWKQAIVVPIYKKGDSTKKIFY